MPTGITHALTGAMAGAALAPRERPWRFVAVATLLAWLPDADVLAFRLGIPYEHPLGHRGLAHGLPFAAAAGLLAMLILFRHVPLGSKRWWATWGCFFGVMAAHDLLDAMTDGGLGVALFSPFDRTRHFLPWRPIRVAPIGGAFFSEWGLRAMASEARWVWLPLAAGCAAAAALRRLRAARRDESP
jgi:inner membrane protein